jgi:hypothetical protein
MATNSRREDPLTGQTLAARSVRAWLQGRNRRGVDLMPQYMNDAAFHASVTVVRRVLEQVAVSMLDLFPLADQLIDQVLVGTLTSLRLDDDDAHRRNMLAGPHGPYVDPAWHLGSDPRLPALRRTCGGRHCQAPIFMATTTNSLMPLDFEPVPVHQGTVMLSWPAVTPAKLVYPFAVVVADVDVRAVVHPGQLWYQPHWATCPDADAFRTAKRKTT